MRHFLTLALAPATLPPRMMQPTLECPLVAPSCHLHALAACLIGARLGAVPLPVITASAHPQLLLTMRAIQHSVAALDDRRPSSPQKAGQVLPIASLSAPEQALLRRSRGPPPKARGCYLGPSPFSAPGPPIALALPNETAAAPPHRSTSRRSNQIHEADGSNLGLSLVNDSGCVARCSPDSRCFCQPFTEGICQPPLPLGAPCQENEECGSRVCDQFDGTCCQRLCDAVDEFCNANGTCTRFASPTQSPNPTGNLNRKSSGSSHAHSDPSPGWFELRHRAGVSNQCVCQ